MSLRGVISASTNPNDNGGFDAFIQNMKAAFQDLTAGAFQFPEPLATKADIRIEGIVQGEIKLGAVNDWKNTLFYGFSDASADIAPGGVHASAILKFASTYGNTLGYTLGGAGPASRKMYGGSNLQGFNVQFKWYTPLMAGWGYAVMALPYLAWPSSPFENKPEPTTNSPEAQSAEKTREKSIRQELNSAADKYMRANSTFEAAAISAYSIEDKSASISAIQALPTAGYSSLGNLITEMILDRNSHDPSDWFSKKDHLLGRLKDGYNLASKVPGYSMSRENKAIKLSPASIGNSINNKDWLDCSESDLLSDDKGVELPADPDPTDVPGATKPGVTAKVADAITGTKLGSATSHLISGLGNLLTALQQSIAMNPPKVKLEIFASDSSSPLYSFSPLVITSFAISGSRETFHSKDGVIPVIITIDVGFDYYLTNATGAPNTPKQIFAGKQIFGGLYR